MGAPYGVNLNALSTYTDQIGFEIISQAVAGTRIMNYSKLFAGDSSGNVSIPVLRNPITVQAASGGWNPAGTFSIAQVQMPIDDLEIKTTYSPYDFRAYYTSVFLNASGQLEEIPYERQLVELFQEQIMLYIETAIFYGDGISVTGLIADTVYGATGSTSIGGTIGYPSWSSGPTGPTSSNNVCWTSIAGATSNALTQVDAMILGLTATVLAHTDLTVYCSFPMYLSYVKAGVNANYFHYNFGDASAGTKLDQQFQIHPGTNVRVVPFSGLGTSCRAILGPSEYLIYAVGLTPDVDYAKIFYDPYNDFVKYIAKWRMGVKIAFPEYFVTNSLA